MCDGIDDLFAAIADLSAPHASRAVDQAATTFRKYIDPFGMGQDRLRGLAKLCHLLRRQKDMFAHRRFDIPGSILCHRIPPYFSGQ